MRSINSREARANWRKSMAVAEDQFAIGQFARYDPQKDFSNLVKAAGRFRRDYTRDFRLVLCGRGVDHNNRELVTMLEREGVLDNVLLLGLQDDVRPIMSSVDIATLASRFGEGLPLSVGESMAMSLPCVVTDVGDSAFLVGSSGVVVPPNQPARLADGWRRLMELPAQERHELGNEARNRVSKKFSLENTANGYLQLYRQLTNIPVAASA